MELCIGRMKPVASFLYEIWAHALCYYDLNLFYWENFTVANVFYKIFGLNIFMDEILRRSYQYMFVCKNYKNNKFNRFESTSKKSKINIMWTNITYIYLCVSVSRIMFNENQWKSLSNEACTL